MSKYDALTGYLRNRHDSEWNATFAEIEQILGSSLPRSAYEHRPWWANRSEQNGSQCLGWQNAGWETRDVDLTNRSVCFFKANGGFATVKHDIHASERNVIAQAKKLLSNGLGVPENRIEITIRV